MTAAERGLLVTEPGLRILRTRRPRVIGAGPQRARAAGVTGSTGGHGWLPTLAVTAGTGLILVAFATNGARASASWALPLFWVGLVVIFAPVALRLVGSTASRQERLLLIMLLAAALYLVKIIHEPTSFTFHDELGFWQATSSTLRTSHLFRPNPVVPAYSVYPGLETVTEAVVKVAGLSIFQAGTLVVGVARLSLAIALFSLFEEATDDARVAGLASLLYMTNPNFLLFDADFAYESLAIPLAVVMLAIVARYVRGRHRADRRLAPLIVLLLFALIVTHHMAGVFMACFLITWTVIAVASVRRHRPIVRVAWVTGIAVAGILAWLFLVAGQVVSLELLPVGKEIVGALGHLATGHQQAEHKQLFHATATGQADALWAQATGFASVALLLLALPVGLWRAWRGGRGGRRGPLVAVLAVLAAAYPASLVLRLTAAGTETSNRASEFVFLGVALFAAWAVLGTRAGLTSEPKASAARARRLLLAACATVVFLGGFIVGWPPYDRLPGPYLPAAADRSIDPVGVAAAQWAGSHLRPGQFVAGDLTDSLLMASYGRQVPQSGVVDGLPVADLFLSASFGPAQDRIIEGDAIDYLIVDSRLSRVPPEVGIYFCGCEPGAGRHSQPILAQDLAKFGHVPSLSRVFDSGPLVIYGTQQVRRSAG